MGKPFPAYERVRADFFPKKARAGLSGARRHLGFLQRRAKAGEQGTPGQAKPQVMDDDKLQNPKPIDTGHVA